VKIDKKKLKKMSRLCVRVIALGALWAYGLMSQ